MNIKTLKNNKIKYTWDLSLLFLNDDDPEILKNREIIKQKTNEFINKWNMLLPDGTFRKDYLTFPTILKQALDEYENLMHFYSTDGKEGFYYWLRTQQDQSNSDLKGKFNKIIEFAQKVENDLQFFLIRISKIDKKTQTLFIYSDELKIYSHFLRELFAESQFLLSEAEEKIMNLKSKTSRYNWINMTSEFLSKEERDVLKIEKNQQKKVKMNYEQIIGEIDNNDKEIRDDASNALNDILYKTLDVAVIELNSVLEDKKVNDELRNVSRPDQLRHLSDDVETEVVDTLIKCVSSRYKISQRYYKLKAQLLGLEKLEYHERNVIYGKLDKIITFEEALHLTNNVFKNLDLEFSKILNEFIKERRIDVYPRKGKVSGAFMINGLKSQPIYILLNFNNQLSDVLTLAHEMGHGIHYTLAKKQNSLNYGTSTLTTEVASTFMEDFVLQEILKEADDELKLSIMMMKLNDEISTIIRQAACYEFETQLHESFKKEGFLSKERLGKLFLSNMENYMGDYVIQSLGSENWWVGWSHIRNSFYVYTYAGGLLISKALQNFVKEDNSFINKVKDYFSSGRSKSPKNIFLELGIDISDKLFWEKGLQEIETLLNNTELLAKKLGKIK